jgi:hypothetical protein
VVSLFEVIQLSISWGMRDRYKFTSCGPLSTWTPPLIAAVYAITYKQDPAGKPKSHTVLYFGESEDLSKQSTINDRVVHFWTEGGGDPAGLYIFVHPMLGSTQFERAKVRERLVSEYMPHANDLQLV